MKFRLTGGSAVILGRSSIRANPIEDRKPIKLLGLQSRPTEILVQRVDKMSAFLDTPSLQLCCPEAEFGSQIHFDSPCLPCTAFPYALPFRPFVQLSAACPDYGGRGACKHTVAHACIPNSAIDYGAGQPHYRSYRTSAWYRKINHNP